MPLVWCSGRNVDRLVAVFKACRRAGRQFIIDLYTAEVLRATGNPRLPQSSWEGVRVFLPEGRRWRVKRFGAFAAANRHRPYRIFPEALAAAAPKSVMLFRPGMLPDVGAARCWEDGCVVWSVRSGCASGEGGRRLADGAEAGGCRCTSTTRPATPPSRTCSGSAQRFPGAVVVPVHLPDRERFAALLAGVVLRDDGEWWTV